jgi:hypothetical protein
MFQENVALMCLDKNFETAENTALFTLSDLLKDFMQEIGKEIKAYTEMNGRTDSNMIDALQAMYNYDMTKDKLGKHMQSKELTLASQSAGFISEYESALNAKVSSKNDAIQQIFSSTMAETLPKANGSLQIPEQIKKLKTFSSIPAHLHSAFPSHLEFNVDPTPVEREVNPSYERIKRVQFKREVENSI